MWNMSSTHPTLSPLHRMNLLPGRRMTPQPKQLKSRYHIPAVGVPVGRLPLPRYTHRTIRWVFLAIPSRCRSWSHTSQRSRTREQAQHRWWRSKCLKLSCHHIDEFHRQCFRLLGSDTKDQIKVCCHQKRTRKRLCSKGCSNLCKSSHRCKSRPKDQYWQELKSLDHR